MDGNGRWAKQRNHARIFGHIRGAQTARSFIQYCSQLKLPFLSLFALSTENVFRPIEEVNALKKILKKVFLRQSSLLMKEKIRLHILGDLSVFSSDLREVCHGLCEKTKHHRGLNLIVALNYGGRQEILKAVQNLVKEVQKNKIQIEDIDEKLFSSFLPSSNFPSPDLILRTGGDVRLSNFYLWSGAYSEFYFTRILWPDFDKKCLDEALQHFYKTKRRFGLL